jgi:hypothetical protein
MNRLVQNLSLLLAFAGALLAAVAGIWRDVPLAPLLARSALTAGVVYVFARLAGELAGRALLRSVAERELEQKDKKKAERAAAAEAESRKAA